MTDIIRNWIFGPSDFEKPKLKKIKKPKKVKKPKNKKKKQIIKLEDEEE